MCRDFKAVVKSLDDRNLHLIIDAWTSRQSFAVMGITAQYVHDWKLRKSVIGFRHFPTSHTARNIKSLLDKFIKEDLGVKHAQVISKPHLDGNNFFAELLHNPQIATVTCDNASNMKKAFELNEEIPVLPNTSKQNASIYEEEVDGYDLDASEFLESNVVLTVEGETEVHEVLGDADFEDLRLTRNECRAHLAQLGIQDACRGSKLVATTANKITTIVSFFNRSTHLYTKLKEVNGGLSLIKPCTTRWNSLHECLKRFIKVTPSKVST